MIRGRVCPDDLLCRPNCLVQVEPVLLWGWARPHRDGWRHVRLYEGNVEMISSSCGKMNSLSCRRTYTLLGHLSVGSRNWKLFTDNTLWVLRGNTVKGFLLKSTVISTVLVGLAPCGSVCTCRPTDPPHVCMQTVSVSVLTKNRWIHWFAGISIQGEWDWCWCFLSWRNCLPADRQGSWWSTGRWSLVHLTVSWMSFWWKMSRLIVLKEDMKSTKKNKKFWRMSLDGRGGTGWSADSNWLRPLPICWLSQQTAGGPAWGLWCLSDASSASAQRFLWPQTSELKCKVNS